MTGGINKFDKLEEYDGGFVKVGNDFPCLVKGRCSLMLNGEIISNGSYWTQGIKYNLLSVSQLNNIGHQLEGDFFMLMEY